MDTPHIAQTPAAVNQITLDATSGPKLVKDLNAKHIKAQYFNQTWEEVRKEVENAEVPTAILAFSGGALGGIAVGILAAAAKGVAAAIALASVATPIGWAAVGCLALAMIVLAARHARMKDHGMETDTADQTGKAFLWAMAGFFVAALLAYIYFKLTQKEKSKGGGGGGSSLMPGGGFAGRPGMGGIHRPVRRLGPGFGYGYRPMMFGPRPVVRPICPIIFIDSGPSRVYYHVNVDTRITQREDGTYLYYKGDQIDVSNDPPPPEIAAAAETLADDHLLNPTSAKGTASDELVHPMPSAPPSNV